MSNLDDFLNKKVEIEKENFKVPNSFDSKVETILQNLDREKPHFKINRKYISIVAMFILIITLSSYGVNNINNFNIEEGTMENSNTLGEKMVIEEAADISELKESTEARGHINRITNDISFLVITTNNLEKEINSKESIDNVLSFFNSLNLNYSESKGIDSYDYEIKINGEDTRIIKIKNNVIQINEDIYTSEQNISDEFEKVYNANKF